jgi:hypothetical protein
MVCLVLVLILLSNHPDKLNSQKIVNEERILPVTRETYSNPVEISPISGLPVSFKLSIACRWIGMERAKVVIAGKLNRLVAGDVKIKSDTLFR